MAGWLVWSVCMAGRSILSAPASSTSAIPDRSGRTSSSSRTDFVNQPFLRTNGPTSLTYQKRGLSRRYRVGGSIFEIRFKVRTKIETRSHGWKQSERTLRNLPKFSSSGLFFIRVRMSMGRGRSDQFNMLVCLRDELANQGG